MSNNRVFITGYGAVSPYGIGAEKMFKGLYENRSAVVSIKEELGDNLQFFNCLVAAPLHETPDPHEVPRKYRRNMGPLAVLAYRACLDALVHAAVPEEKIGSPEVGLVFSSSTGSVDSLEEAFRVYLNDTQRVLPHSGSFFKIMSHTCSANVAHALSIRGVNYSVSSACASSTQAIGIAYDQLKNGRQEIMICGGAEEMHPLVVSVFDVLQAASWNYNEKPTQTPRPFDSLRDGTVCGAGAGALILEIEESAYRRKAQIFGEIIGYFSNIDTTSMAQSSKESIVMCLQGALSDANIKSEQIDYINAHATATIVGDISESLAIAEVFRDNNVPVSSLKGHMGHTLAASGALEIIASLEMMRCGKLLPTRNLVTPAPEATVLCHVPSSGQEKKVSYFIKNSFAFGGINAVIIVKKYKK